jgi:dynein heavy chain
LRLTENGYEYEPIEVLSYKAETEEFTILWKKDKKIEKLKRIYICFDSEDPRKYAARLQRAF